MAGDNPHGLPPLRDGRYDDFKVAGEGGMGIVYWALDTDLNRQVAFKVVRPDVGARRGDAPPVPLGMSPPTVDTPASKAFETLKARFLQEAWVTAGLEHPGIVPVYELGQTPEGVPFYTMRFVRGSQTLATAIDDAKDKPIEVRLALLEPFLRICDTIRYAHAHGVIHRDLKPENVAIGEFGEVVVLDWGLAKMRDQEDAAAETWQERLREYREAADLQTIAGAMGTPGYMAPEAALGRIDELDERCDVYSLGAILFEILTGRLPFEFRTYIDLVMKVTEEEAPSATGFNPSVPDALSAICANALAREKGGRFAGADELADAIRDWQRESAVEREVRELLTKAEAAFEGTEGLEGEALLKQIDRVTSSCARIAENSPAHPKAEELVAACGEVRERAMEQRERAARGRLLRRVAVAVIILLVAMAGVVVLIVDAKRQEADAEREAKQEALADVLRLADVRRVRDLVAEVEEKRPLHPERKKNLTDWIRRAEELVGNRKQHERALAALRQRALPRSEEDLKRSRWRFEEPEIAWQHEEFSNIVAGIDSLAAEEDGRLKTMRERLRFVERIEERLTGEDREAWRETIATISDEGESSAYKGLEIEPIPGLVPLGRDSDSGLIEFAHLGSGTVPVRDPETGKLRYAEDASIVLVLIPGGCFHMGAQKEAPDDPNYDSQASRRESPVRKLTVRPFLMGKHECTQAQWAAMTGGRRPSRIDEERLGRATERHPVEEVSWEDIRPWLAHHRLRLPSESEWEFACRAGSRTRFSFGDADSDLGRYAWFMQNSKNSGTHRVGEKLSSAWGLYDMHGNVWEWCEDSYGPYDMAPMDGTARTTYRGAKYQVCRGGCWNRAALFCRSACRDGSRLSGRDSTMGFRPALSLP